MASAETILTRTEGILRIDRSTIGLPALEEMQLLAVLSDANTTWVEAHKKAGGEPEEYMQSDGGGTLVSGTDLDGAITASSTEIDLTSASDFDDSGLMAVYDNDMTDLIAYTGKTSNQLTGVTGIGYSHTDGTEAFKLYALPTNFRNMRQEEHNRDGVKVQSSEFTYTSRDPIGSHYTIRSSGSKSFLWFPRSMSGNYKFIYNIKSTTIDDTSDEVNIPDSQPENQWYLVWKLVSYGKEILEVAGVELAEARASKILRVNLKKKSISRRVRMARGRIDMSSSFSQEVFNPNAGFRGTFR